jgi:site-specific DNA-methyltransferase (adenine-specific)
MSIEIWEGNCFELMDSIEANSVDAIITDPPYGTTALSWDKKIDLVAWWEHVARIIKPSGVIAMFSAQPFTTDLISSNRKWFRYELIWEKTAPMGFLDANQRPLRIHENILIFSQFFRRSNQGKRAASTYNPQFTIGKPYVKKRRAGHHTAHYDWTGEDHETVNTGTRYPVDVLHFSNRNHKSLHPTQKPIELLTWLVLTYTNPGELVLDPFSGSGTTLVTCQQNGRRAIGIEQDSNYIEVTKQRIDVENFTQTPYNHIS